MSQLNRLKTLLEENNSFLLICHVEPDGDAAGSLLALGEGLQNIGKSVCSVCSDEVPNILHFLKNVTLIERHIPDKIFDAVILLDNGDFRRTGFVDELKALKSSGVPIANIDHHTRNDLWKFVNINYADEFASSASELVYELMIHLGWEITPSIATSLIAGIYNDTGGFRHPNTTDDVLMIVADLLKKGGNLKKVAKNIENSRPVSLFKLWGIALDRMVIDSRFNLAVSYLTQKDIAHCESSEDDIPGLVNLINAVPQVRATLLLYEGSDGKIKGSLRTDRDDIDVSVLAQLLGGGGHKRAAGFSFNGRIEKRGNSVVVI